MGGVGGLLVERDGRALLIDAGAGPLTMDTGYGVLTGGALLESLAALGRAPEGIEAVAVTHLHVDHIGWADHPAFAHARVLVAVSEWTRRQDPLGALEPRVCTVTDGEEVFPGVRATLAPGHTAGHTAYVIEAGGQRVIGFGVHFADVVFGRVTVDNGHPVWHPVDA
ncbi:MBL fold metallo-hydrolase [Streptomyces acidiscabies]|uniref:MBL fold metallo-hydrolase n=1 Tax=Streptomyces acidiscabies TaxID=42234 RepID=UPI0038F7B61C